MHDEEGIRQFIARVFVCPADVADQILSHGRLCAYAGHAVIVRQGEALASSYLVVLGRARALLYAANGQVVLLHEYCRGDIFGAVGEPDSAMQDADVVAVDDVQALVIRAAHLALLAQRHGCIGLALSRLLILRLRQINARMYERAALSSVGRVYSELLRQARLRPDLVIAPAPVVSDLALIVATTRETASRAVNALERRGIIRREADALVVVAPHRLEELIL
ncbi:MAG: Crp/Fnr family transcriptional regulator [Pseudomonadota bacterium]